MRAANLPPSRRSTALRVVCQLSCGVFHWTMSSGLLQAVQIWFSGAFTTASTVIFMAESLDVRCGYELVEQARGKSTGVRKYSAVDSDARRATSSHVPVSPNPSPGDRVGTGELLAARRRP